MDDAEKLALADGYERAGIAAAKQGASKEPWYQNARQDIAHAANCFAVAAALRSQPSKEQL
jgi:hypothetical protein